MPGAGWWVQANKQHQLADWRVRPLPEELLAYARSDTHHLLYIHDRLKVLLCGLHYRARRHVRRSRRRLPARLTCVPEPACEREWSICGKEVGGSLLGLLY